MLRVASRTSTAAARRMVPHASRRLAHGVHYGPAEPIGYYYKWVAVVGGFMGLLAYDRYYSEGAISQLVTPETDVKAIEAQRERVAARLDAEQARNVELLFPRERSALMTNFGPHPVPEGSYRAGYTNGVVDTESLGERRPRAVR